MLSKFLGIDDELVVMSLYHNLHDISYLPAKL